MEHLSMHSPKPEQWIGAFDSGLGGLAIVREVARLLPRERVFYIGDTLHMPYGMRSLDEVRALSRAVTERLLMVPSKVIIIACNTASAASLAYLRESFPDRIFVGMEPAVKPAALNSKTGKIGVLATPATFEGEPFKRLKQTFSSNAEIVSQPCPGLADAIEMHGSGSKEVETLLTQFIDPLLPLGIDHLVLGCTHYSLVKPDVSRIAGSKVTIVDPSPAIAVRVHQVLGEAGLLTERGAGEMVFRVTGDSVAFSRSASLLMNRDVEAEQMDIHCSQCDALSK